MSPARLLAGLIFVTATLPAAAAGNGLVLPALESPHWQTRFEFDAPMTLGRLPATIWAIEQTPLSGRLISDYRFDALRLGQTGGLRLTSGVLVNLRNPATFTLGSSIAQSGDNPSAAQPYAGIGYSAGTRGDWGFSAELGVAAQNPGAASQFGRVFNGFSLGDTVRDMRLQPVIRLGMNYAF